MNESKVEPKSNLDIIVSTLNSSIDRPCQIFFEDLKLFRCKLPPPDPIVLGQPAKTTQPPEVARNRTCSCFR